MSEGLSAAARRKTLQRVQHRLDARDLVRSEKIGLPQRRQHGEERFRPAHLLSKILKGVRQGVTNRKSQRPQTKRVQKNRHLAPDPRRAVLQISIIKSEARVN